MLTRELWFPTPIWYGEIDVTGLEKLCKKYSGVKADNQDNGYSEMVNGKKGYKRVEADVLKQAQFVFEDLYSERKGGYDMVNMWVNNNSKGDYHKLHVHPDCDLSGCFYVNTPVKSGNIRFEDPNYLLKMNQETLNKHVMTFVTRVTVDYVPTVGKLLFFPSWLRHEVLQNHSEEERISIAFNLKLRFD